EILWQFTEAIDGIRDACVALDIPVVGGNVSFYNETLGHAILPTPVVGMAGVVQGAPAPGPPVVWESRARGAPTRPRALSLRRRRGGSEYLSLVHRRRAGQLAALDVELERRVQEACRAAIGARLLRSAHDTAEGGLAVALAESCISGPTAIGARIELQAAAHHA